MVEDIDGLDGSIAEYDKGKPKDFIIKKFQRNPSNAYINNKGSNLQNINIYNVNSNHSGE